MPEEQQTTSQFSLSLQTRVTPIPTMPSAQPDRINQCLSELRSNSDETRERALRTLTSLTKVNPQNRTFLVQSEGAISAILALSRPPSSVTQTISLAVLFNISLNPELKHSLANTETISRLNSVIASPATSPDAARLAASLACSLATLDKNKAKFGVSGTIQILVAAVSGPHGPASHHLLSSLAELVRFHGNATLAVRSGAVPVLLRAAMLGKDDNALSGASLAALSLLARFGEGLEALRNSEGIVERLADVLSWRCMLSREGAAEILVRLFEESEGFVREAVRLPGFTGAVADLSVRGSARARESAALLMRKIQEGDWESCVEASPLFGPVGIEF